MIRGEQIPIGTSGKRRPYCELGKMLDTLARRRDVRGPYNIASYLKDVAGFEVSGQAVSKYLYGESWPKHAFIGAFTEALNLTSEERGKLAWVYTYGVFPETAEDKDKTQRLYEFSHAPHRSDPDALPNSRTLLTPAERGAEWVGSYAPLYSSDWR